MIEVKQMNSKKEVNNFLNSLGFKVAESVTIAKTGEVHTYNGKGSDDPDYSYTSTTKDGKVTDYFYFGVYRVKGSQETFSGIIQSSSLKQAYKEVDSKRRELHNSKPLMKGESFKIVPRKEVPAATLQAGTESLLARLSKDPGFMMFQLPMPQKPPTDGQSKFLRRS